MFNEETLRRDIAGHFGEYGAHIEVFDAMVNSQSAHLATIARQREVMREAARLLSGVKVETYGGVYCVDTDEGNWFDRRDALIQRLEAGGET